VAAATVACDERLPVESKASTPITYPVPHANPVSVYAVAVVVAAAVEFRYRPYPATPTLSVAACHDNEIVVAVTAVTAAAAGTEGAVVSGVGQAAVVAALETREDLFPALS
jgi:hypothetical protein